METIHKVSSRPHCNGGLKRRDSLHETSYEAEFNEETGLALWQE